MTIDPDNTYLRCLDMEEGVASCLFSETTYKYTLTYMHRWTKLRSERTTSRMMEIATKVDEARV